MNYLTLENVTRTYGEKVLFKDLNLQINKGQKVALVAKNGSGKTTLLRVLAGEEASEGPTSKVQFHRGVRVGYLTQDPQFDGSHTILEAVFDMDNPMVRAVHDYELAMLRQDTGEGLQAALAQMDDLKAWDFESKVKEILFKLELSKLDQLVGNLSGGGRKRLALARLMIDEPEFLILDEPTNHLDLDMIEWLEGYLQQPSFTLFMVTHDRYFLERVCDTIVELDRGNIYKYSGNYTDFLEKKSARQENDLVVHDKEKKLMKRELDWIRRQPQARTTKAKSRVNAFDDLYDRATRKVEQTEIQIDIKGSRLGSKILEAHYISKAYDGRKMVDLFNYKFKKGEKVGIVGKNGIGKSTFLKMLTQEIRPDSGKVVVGETVVFGYYSQDGMQLQEDKRVLDVVQDIAEYIPLEKGQKMSASQLLERFLFSRPQQEVYASQLSGGEKRRLYLLTVLIQNPNFLILDEPTNDLDILTLNVLEDFLQEFQGCVLIVSHDRYFMDKLVDHIFVFEGDGQIKDFNGDYTDYRAMALERDRELKRLEKEKLQAVEKANPVVTTNKSGLSQDERKELKRVEREIAQLEEKKGAITEQFNSATLSPNEIEKLSKELSEVGDKIEEKEMRWMELVEKDA